MLETTFISGILNIEIEEHIDETILDFANLIITNNHEKSNTILNDYVTYIIGLNEKSFLLNNKTVLLSKYNIEETDVVLFNPKQYLEKFMIFSEYFCLALWLIKDNSVEFELAHLIYGSGLATTVHTNFWSSSYTTVTGKTVTTKFSKNEILEAQKALSIILHSTFYKDKQRNPSLTITNDISRLSRSLIFLSSARSTNDIGTKISIYCSVFESLFSVSNSELRHRLSETIAFFLSEISEERISLYKTIQKAYDIRSSIVHGDGIQSKFMKNENKLLFEVAIETDKILRLCFKRIFTEEEIYELFTKKNKVDLSNYFQNLILAS